jgi:hypothetical protein
MQASPAPPPTALAKIPEVNNPRTAIELAADACRSSLQERPQNGTEAETSKVTAGHGTLTISNGNSEDSAVILSNSAMDSDDRLMYIRAGMTAIIRNIPPGQYRIQFQIGKSWDAEAERFRCVIATAMFDRTASFEENETEHEIQYADIQITLHKLSGGNARTTSITPAAFLRRRKQG